MSTISSRIKKIRKENNLNQSQFGEKIGVNRDVISNIELDRNKNGVSDNIIKLIAITFSINENWLKTGVGEPYVQTSKNVLSELKRKYALDNLDVNIIETYLKLEPLQRKAIKEYVFKLADSIGKSSTNNEQPPTAPNIRKFNISAGDAKRNDDKELVWSAARSTDNNSPAGMTEMSNEDLKALHNAPRVESDDDL